MAVYKEINRADGSGVTTFYRISNVLDTAETDDQEGQAVIVDYNQAQNKPSINGVTLIGNKTTEDLGLQPAGDYITNDEADEKFIDEDELEAKNYVNQAELQDAIAHIEHFHREIVEALPVTGMDNVLYMVRKGGTGEDIYNEYIWVGLSSSEDGYEFLGTTATDLTDYYKKSQVDAALATKVDKEGGKGLSEQNYTLAEKTKLAGLENYDDTEIQAEVSGLSVDVNNLKSSNVTISNALAELKPDVDSNTSAVSTIYDLLDNKMTAIRLVEQGDGWVWMNLEGSRLTYAQASAALGHENCMLFIEQLENDGKVIPAEYKSEGDHINVIFKDLDSLVHIMTCGEDDALVTKDVTTTNGQVNYMVEDEAVGYTTKITNIYGDSGQQTYTGKNLFKINSIIKNAGSTFDASYTILGDNSFSARVTRAADGDIATCYFEIPIDVSTILPNTQYTLSKLSNIQGTAFPSAGAIRTHINGNYGATQEGDVLTFTTPDTLTTMGLLFYGTWNDTTAGEIIITFENIQLEEGDSQTSYEPYTGGQLSPNPDYPQDIHVVKGNNTVEVTDGDAQTNTLPLSLGLIELCKMGTYQDKIYKQNDTWYLHKEIGKYTFNGDEPGWRQRSVNTNGTCTYHLDDNAITSIVPYKLKDQIPAYCDYFKYDGTVTAGDNMKTKGVVTCLYQTNNSTTRSYYVNSTIQTLANFKSWLVTHTPVLYYVLETPIDTEITDQTLLAQLEALEQITQYKNTYITITGADLTPEADFTYIDNVVINNTDLVLGKDTYWNDEVPTQQDLPSNAQEGEIRIVQDTENVYIYNGTKWVPFDKSGEVDLSNYLAKDNTTAWIPTGPFNPSTKKYVDDSISGIHVPTKTSQLTNDSNFINKNANDLTNYYPKSNTYTRAEVDALIHSGGTGVQVVVVGDTLVITTVLPGGE